MGSDPNDHHFRTDHLLVNLKHRTISSGFVTMLAQGAKFALNLASMMIMARLLTPGEFGVAMVTTVTSLLSVFADAGLSTATIQRENITHAQVSNLFWMNVAISAVMSISLAACPRFSHGFIMSHVFCGLPWSFPPPLFSPGPPPNTLPC